MIEFTQEQQNKAVELGYPDPIVMVCDRPLALTSDNELIWLHQKIEEFDDDPDSFWNTLELEEKRKYMTLISLSVSKEAELRG